MDKPFDAVLVVGRSSGADGAVDQSTSCIRHMDSTETNRTWLTAVLDRAADRSLLSDFEELEETKLFTQGHERATPEIVESARSAAPRGHFLEDLFCKRNESLNQLKDLMPKKACAVCRTETTVGEWSKKPTHEAKPLGLEILCSECAQRNQEDGTVPEASGRQENPEFDALLPWSPIPPASGRNRTACEDVVPSSSVLLERAAGIEHSGESPALMLISTRYVRLLEDHCIIQ